MGLLLLLLVVVQGMDLNPAGLLGVVVYDKDEDEPSRGLAFKTVSKAISCGVMVEDVVETANLAAGRC